MKALFWKTLGIVALLQAMFWAGLVGLWVGDRRLPVDRIMTEVENTEVRPGGMIRVRYVVNRSHTCPVTIERVLVDSEKVRHLLEPAVVLNPGEIGAEEFAMELPVPRTVAAGRAVYRVTRAWACNPVHKFWPVLDPQPPIEFTVLPCCPRDRPCN